MNVEPIEENIYEEDPTRRKNHKGLTPSRQRGAGVHDTN